MTQKLDNALRWIVGILNKHNIKYQISGGFAAHIYGAQRAVNDIDIEIPDTNFGKILDEVKPYLTFGPGQYTDKKWDLLLMTLNYNGQEIDICGGQNTRIFDSTRNKWVNSNANFETAKKIKFMGLELSVIDPQELIDYKTLLDGEHQKSDIAAVINYIIKN